MYALIETGGKQYKAVPGTMLKVEKLDAAQGSEVKIDKVLAVFKEDGSIIGTPYVANASVSAEVVKIDKADKILVFKKKPRKGYMNIKGHRQIQMTLMIKEIQGV